MRGKHAVAMAVLVVAAAVASGRGTKESTGAPAKEGLSTVPVYTERDIASAAGLQSVGGVLRASRDGLLAILERGTHVVLVDRGGRRKRAILVAGADGVITNFAVGPDGSVSVLFVGYPKGASAMTAESVALALRVYAPDGALRWEWDLGSTPQDPQRRYHVSDIAVGSGGVVYLATSNGIETVSGAGSRARTVSGAGYSAIVVDESGHLIAGGYDPSGGSGSFLRKIEPASGKVVWEVSSGYARAMAYRGSDQGIYVYDGQRVLKYDTDGGLLGVVFVARDYGLPDYQSYGPCMVVDDRGGLCFLATKYDEAMSDGKAEPHLLVYERSSEPPRGSAPTLTVSHAYYYQRDIDIAVRLYQRTHPGARVEVRRTLEQADMDGEADFRSFLVTEIMAGKAADVVNCTLLPFESLARKGVLADLDQLMACDPSFRADEYFGSVIGTFRVDGALYALPASYWVTIMMAGTGALEDAGVRIDDKSWTWEDFVVLAGKLRRDTNGDGTPDQYALYKMSGYEFFSRFLLPDRIDDFVDLVNRTARLDTSEFAGLLELARLTEERRLFSPEVDSAGWVEACARGQGVFYPIGMNSYLSLSAFRNLFPRGVVSLRPPDAGKRGAALSVVSPYAVSARSPRLDAAWDFLKTMVSYEVQADRSFIGLRVNRKAGAADVTKWQEGIKKGQVSFGLGGWSTRPGPLSEADIAFGDALIAEVRRNTIIEPGLSAIIRGEARRYFSGQIGAEEAARTAQAKVTIYLSE